MGGPATNLPTSYHYKESYLVLSSVVFDGMVRRTPWIFFSHFDYSENSARSACSSYKYCIIFGSGSRTTWIRSLVISLLLHFDDNVSHVQRYRIAPLRQNLSLVVLTTILFYT